MLRTAAYHPEVSAGGLTDVPGRFMLPGMPRLFTIEEANRLLPELRKILSTLRAAIEDLEAVQETAAELYWKLRTNGHDIEDSPLDRQRAAREAIQEQIERIQALGCELRDPRLGLIDFPSQRGDELVYLCWKLDEPEVAFWHPLDSGFAGRRPL